MTISLIVPLAVIVLLVVFLGYYGVYVPQTLAFTLTPKELQIRGDVLYGRRIPRSDLFPDRARIADDGSVQIELRTNGIGLPNYKGGWFRTSIGKSLVFIRPGPTMLTVPTDSGYTLLIAPQEPQRFLDALRTPDSTFQSKLAQ